MTVTEAFELIEEPLLEKPVIEEPQEKIRKGFLARIGDKIKAAWNWFTRTVKRVAKATGDFIARAARTFARVIKKGALAVASGIGRGARATGRGLWAAICFTGVALATGLTYVGRFFTFVVRVLADGVSYALLAVVVGIRTILYIIAGLILVVLSSIYRIAQAIALVLSLPHTLRVKGATPYVWTQWRNSWHYSVMLSDEGLSFPHNSAWDKDLAEQAEDYLAWKAMGFVEEEEQSGPFAEETEAELQARMDAMGPEAPNGIDMETGEEVESDSRRYHREQREKAEAEQAKGKPTPKQTASRPPKLSPAQS